MGRLTSIYVALLLLSVILLVSKQVGASNVIKRKEAQTEKKKPEFIVARRFRISCTTFCKLRVGCPINCQEHECCRRTRGVIRAKPRNRHSCTRFCQLRTICPRHCSGVTCCRRRNIIRFCFRKYCSRRRRCSSYCARRASCCRWGRNRRFV